VSSILAKRHIVGLTDDERTALEQVEAGPLTHRLRYRAQILLGADAGEDTEPEMLEAHLDAPFAAYRIPADAYRRCDVLPAAAGPGPAPLGVENTLQYGKDRCWDEDQPVCRRPGVGPGSRRR